MRVAQRVVCVRAENKLLIAVAAGIPALKSRIERLARIAAATPAGGAGGAGAGAPAAPAPVAKAGGKKKKK